MDVPGSIGNVLADVGLRLKGARAERDVTLDGLVTATGNSKSTLSGLESGQRKPNLELLLASDQAHGIPHWFGSAGARPVEILSILSRACERIHVRARPRRETADG